MANPITKIEHDELHSTLRVIEKVGGTTDHTDWMRGGTDGANAALLLQFIDQQCDISDKNPYETTVDQQLAILRCANEDEKWGLTEADFDRLASTAPAWPKGKYAYRSLRIRFGDGDKGVAKTFEAHCARIKRVFGDGRYWRWGQLRSSKVTYRGRPVECLRLLNGNHTHHAVVEWIVADLDCDRKRASITAVRDAKSLADELLVIVWMFPDMIRAIHSDKLSELFAAGYEVNTLEEDGRAWWFVVLVNFYRRKRLVAVRARARTNCHPRYSVPRLR